MQETGERIEVAPSNLRAESGRPRRSFLVSAFCGPDGLRSGWRLLIFFAILAVLAETRTLSFHAMNLRHSLQGKFGLFAGPLWWATHTKALGFIFVLIANWIMARIEARRLASFGLPLKRAFRKAFWQGAAIGFAAITSLLFATRLLGVFHFGSIGLHGAQIGKYAILSGVACLFTGLFEESLYRGYVQFTLTTGVGFWPAAIITSVVFGYVHHSNRGETLVGTFSAGAAGFLFCLLLRRTGDLWMPVGFHTAWNWGESYFFGVPDSGGVSSRHLFSAVFSGPQWLTGGTVGPEGSWLCLILIAILFVVFARSMRQVNSASCGKRV